MRYLAQIVICLVPLSVYAELPSGPGDFPQWRGPNRDGMSADTGLLKAWAPGGPERAWKIENVGVGYSSIAIKDGVIVTMGDLGGIEHIIALRVSDGSRIWAVQPAPVKEALEEKIAEQVRQLDANKDGVVDQLEGMRRLGWDFYKYDRDSGASDAKANTGRARSVFTALDKDNDSKLSVLEAGPYFRDHFARMDASDPDQTEALAKQRTDEAFGSYDKDEDGKLSRKEVRGTSIDPIFRRADRREPGTNRGDELVTPEELSSYYSKHEAGKDGLLTSEEVGKYYAQNVKSGDGKLSDTELKEIYGGYRNNQGDGPRGTPTIDGELVYTEGGNGDVTCTELHSGRTRWHLNLQSDLGGRRPGWGYSESPLIEGDLVIVTPGGPQGTVAALNKRTGELVWQSKDITEGAHYASGVVAEIGGIRQFVQVARENAFGLDLKTGRLLWTYGGANNGTANCCTPIVDQDHVFVASAYGTGGGLAKVTTADSTQAASETYFEPKMGIHHGGIVKIGDYMYSNGAGTLICINFLTGEIAWQDRSVGKGSLVAADGMLYVLSERQQLALVEATPEEYRERGRIETERYGRPSWAHPVVAGGVLYIRDQHTLSAYKLR